MNFLSSEILLLFPDSSRQKYNSEKVSRIYSIRNCDEVCCYLYRLVAYIPLLKNTSHCD